MTPFVLCSLQVQRRAGGAVVVRRLRGRVGGGRRRRGRWGRGRPGSRMRRGRGWLRLRYLLHDYCMFTAYLLSNPLQQLSATLCINQNIIIYFDTIPKTLIICEKNWAYFCSSDNLNFFQFSVRGGREELLQPLHRHQGRQGRRLNAGQGLFTSICLLFHCLLLKTICLFLLRRRRGRRCLQRTAGGESRQRAARRPPEPRDSEFNCGSSKRLIRRNQISCFCSFRNLLRLVPPS